MIRAELEGADQVQRAFDMFPDQMIKELRRSITRHLRALTSRIKSQAPKPEWASFVTQKVSNKSGRVSGVVGYFGDRAQGWEWYKAYWLNYGTLAGRDPAHEFKRPRRNRQTKQKNGIPYQHFFEKSIDGQDGIVMSQVEKDLENFVNKMNND